MIGLAISVFFLIFLNCESHSWDERKIKNDFCLYFGTEQIIENSIFNSN